jgi:hypothetical protein
MDIAINDFSMAVTINPEDTSDANSFQIACDIAAGKSVTFDYEMSFVRR